MHPAWSDDGGELTVARGSGATFRGRTLTHNPWWDVVRVPAEGGDATRVIRVALPTGSGPERVQRRAILAPSWGPEGRIFFPEIIDGGTAVVSVQPDGEDRRVHLILPSADEVAVSPDGRWIAFQEANDVFVAPLPRSGGGDAPLRLDRRSSGLPVRQLSRTVACLFDGVGRTLWSSAVAADTTVTTWPPGRPKRSTSAWSFRAAMFQARWPSPMHVS